jgi:hypothetical protein
MAIQFVNTNQLVGVNGVFYLYPSYLGGIEQAIPCRSVPMGFFWLTPIVQGNRVIGYDQMVAVDASKPSPDSLKVLRLKDALNANTVYEIAVLDSDGVTGNTFIDNCNGCCGDTPVMPTVTIPHPILQLPPQSTTATTRTFVFPFPSNPNARLYAIPFPWFNGVAPAQAYEPAGITTPAQFVTWANTSGKWDDYGTWSATGDVITLVNSDSSTIVLSRAGMSISLTPTPFCFNMTAFSTPAAVNSVQFGTGAVFTFPPFMLTNANQQTVINSIRQFIPEATFVISSNKLQVSTVQAAPKLKNGATTVVTASAGAC